MADQSHSSTTHPMQVTCQISWEVWQALQQQCVKNGTVPSDILERLVRNYLDTATTPDLPEISFTSQPIPSESSLDQLVSYYVQQKVEKFLDQKLEVQLSSLFEHYFKLHLKRSVEQKLQTTFPASETEKPNSNNNQTDSQDLHSSTVDTAPENIFKNSQTSASSGETVSELTDSKATDSEAAVSKAAVSETSNSKPILKTAKELAEILRVSAPYIATLNRIGDLEKRGWQDSGQRRGKTVLYKPIH